MDTTRKSVVPLALLLTFFIIASDMCLKLEARGPIVHLHCSSDESCQLRPCAAACGCKCIDTFCQCTRPYFNDNTHHTHAPPN
uniref:Uncharacterized protein n=1 Tax=Cajanus cajan TaxID=3821 RepID=A0A151QWE1_CAJCA|nr:hypothetical protein KK1_044400 [Cajanus cajan]